MEERRSSPEEFLRRCENENQAKGRGLSLIHICREDKPWPEIVPADFQYSDKNPHAIQQNRRGHFSSL